MAQLLEFLRRLEENALSYSLEHNREDAIMVLVAIPGERWEIEFFQDGKVEIEIFGSSGKIYDRGMIEQLFERHSDA
jgi:hypothetical protein